VIVGWPEELKKMQEMKATEGVALMSDIAGMGDYTNKTLFTVFEGIPFFQKSMSVGTALNVVGAVATGIEQFQESTAQSTFFKTTDAVTAGLMDWAIGSGNPLIAVGDSLLGAATKEIFGVEINMGSTANGAAHALNTFVDGVISWDEQGMQSFHEKSLNGDYGMIIQGWSMIGEVISQNYELHPAVVNTLKPFDFDEIRARYEASQPKVPSLRLGE
jgi:hypothetical protein